MLVRQYLVIFFALLWCFSVYGAFPVVNSEELISVDEESSIGLEAKLYLIRGDDNNLNGFKVSLLNSNIYKDLSFLVYEDIASSIMITLVDLNGNRINLKARKYSTEEHPIKKIFVLYSGKEKSWFFPVSDMVPKDVELYKFKEIHVLVDVYMDLLSKKLSDKLNSNKIKLHLNKFNIATK